MDHWTESTFCYLKIIVRIEGGLAMKKTKIIALSLAASLAFSFASVSEMGFVGTNPAHAASFSEALGPDFDASLHRVPVTTRTHYFVDSDEKGPLLRSQWSAIDFYGKPEEPVKNISITLANYSREKSQDFEKTRREMLKQAKQDRSERLKGGSTFSLLLKADRTSTCGGRIPW